MIRNLTKEEVSFTLKAEQNIAISGYIVTVTAEWNGFKGEPATGCYSFQNEADFRNGTDYENMRSEALARLQQSISDLHNRFQILES